MSIKNKILKKRKDKNRPRKDASVNEELEFLRGENRDLRARCLKLARQLKAQQSSVKEDMRDLEDLARDTVKKGKLSTTKKCKRCGSDMLTSKLPHALMHSCMKCNEVEMEKK